MPVQLIAPTLTCLERLVAGDAAAIERDMGVAFHSAAWPDDIEMREGLAVHLAACRQHPRDLRWRVFLIIDEYNAAAGHAGFKGEPGRSGEVEIYWCIEPQWRGRGLARAAAATLCAQAFAGGAVTAITATISRQNVASQHVAAALGMRPVAQEIKHGLPLWRVPREAWREPPVTLRMVIPDDADLLPGLP
jgi:RimJ/RimL family protein N-acetyltransferase